MYTWVLRNLLSSVPSGVTLKALNFFKSRQLRPIYLFNVRIVYWHIFQVSSYMVQEPANIAFTIIKVLMKHCLSFCRSRVFFSYLDSLCVPSYFTF